MAWIKSHQELRDHPKTRKLAHILNISRPTAIGHLQCLWWWCLDYADDGDLSRFDPIDIALGADWEGDSGDFVDVLVTVGFLDVCESGGLRVHDWDDYAGALVRRRVANTERMKQARAQHVRAHTSTGAQHVQVPEKRREEKRRVDTTTDVVVSAANADAPTPKAKHATQVPDGFTVTDGLEAWGAKQEPPFSPESMRVEVPQFVDYYQAKGETRKDWDASFRTWMRNSRKWTKPNPPPKSGNRITSIDELFANGDDDDRDRSQEDSRNTATTLASDRLGQVGGASMDGRYEEARFRAIAGGRR